MGRDGIGYGKEGDLNTNPPSSYCYDLYIIRWDKDWHDYSLHMPAFLFSCYLFNHVEFCCFFHVVACLSFKFSKPKILKYRKIQFKNNNLEDKDINSVLSKVHFLAK